MRWRDLRRSDNVRDERGMGGGGGGFSLGRVGGGIGGIALLFVAYMVGGPDAVLQLLSSGGGAPSGTPREGAPLSANDDTSQFVAAILGSTEDVWGEVFAASG